MKLPKGNITKTIPGGPESLKNILNELQEQSFSGYLQINYTKEGADSKGQILLEEGSPILSDYEHQETTYSGSGAIKHLIKDSIKEDSSIEVHSDIEDIGLMVTLFSKARIDPDDLNIEKNLEEILEEEAREKEETARKAQEEARKAEITEQINSWKIDGYSIVDIEGFDEKPLEEIEPVFKEYKKAIRKLHEAEQRLGELDIHGFDNEVASIQSKLKDPILITDLDKELADLESAIQDREVRVTELKKQIEKWREDGYEVAKLESTIEEDFAKAWDEFTTFMDNISTLKELKGKLSDLETKGFNTQKDTILEKLKDPDKIPEIEADLAALGQAIEEEKAKKAQLRQMMEDWSSQGYVITNLENTLSEKNFQDAEPAFIDYEKNLHNLKKVAEKLKALEMEELSQEIEGLSANLNDPDNLTEVTEQVNALEAKAVEINAKKAEFRTKMEDYKNNGLNTTSLEGVITGRLDVIENSFKGFKNKLVKLQEFGEKLGNLNTIGFEAEVETIQAKLKDVEVLEETSDQFAELETKIAEVEQKRNEIRSQIDEWKEQGFIVDKVEGIIDGNIESLWDAFTTLTDDIQSLKDLKSKLKKLDTKNFKAEADAIAAKLNNPDLKAEIEQDISGLAESIKADKARRAEINENLEAWTNEGYIITRIESFLEGNLSELETEFSRLQQDISNLKALEEKFNGFDLKGFKEEADPIRSRIKDPDAVADLQQVLTELEDKIEQAKILREVIRTKLEAWRNEEFIVTDLENVIDGKLATAQKVADDLEAKIETLKNLASKFNSLDTIWFKEDANSIESKLKDPTAIEAIEQELPGLEDKIAQDQSQRAGFQAKLNEWKSMGLKVGPLEEALSQDLKTIETEFGSFESDLKKLLALQEKIGVISGTPTIQAEAGAPKKDKSVEWEEEPDKPAEAPDKKKEAAKPPKKKKKPLPKESEAVQEGGDLAKCGSCGELVPADLTKCPKCGVSFGGEIFECPICKAMVSADEPKCTNCGAEFEVD